MLSFSSQLQMMWIPTLESTSTSVKTSSPDGTSCPTRFVVSTLSPALFQNVN